MNNKFYKLPALALAFAMTAPLMSMKAPSCEPNWLGMYGDAPGMATLLRVKTQTEANETKYNDIEHRPFVTLAVMQTAPRFYSLESYVAQLTNNAEQLYQTPMGVYRPMDPNKWHMSLLNLALPLSDRLIRLSKDPKKQGMFKTERRRYANIALRDLAIIVSNHVQRLKGIEFKYCSIGGIGTNKFIAAYFDFKNAYAHWLYHQVYADILSEFLELYPSAWMRYGFEFLPHVSVMKKYYRAGAVPKVQPQGVPSLGSGRGIEKVAVVEVPAEPVIENLELLFNRRHILVSARDEGYPLAVGHKKAADFFKRESFWF